MTVAPPLPKGLEVELAGLRLAHPVLNGSGTWDAIAAMRTFGAPARDELPFAAFVSKTITLAPRGGNPPPRLWETPAGPDQLDRAAEQGPGGLPGPRPAGAGRPSRSPWW